FIQNIIAPQLQWDTPSRSVEELPRRIRAGIAVPLVDWILAAADIQFQANRPTRLFCGVEGSWNSVCHFRGGLEDGVLSLGTGLSVSTISLDVSWSAPKLSDGVMDPIYRTTFGIKF
ncbi:hypothetical protein EBR96_07630, partial [bacterium]|nr:hypothetical protein [bacterium]